MSGIRTHARRLVPKTSALDHSAITPPLEILLCTRSILKMNVHAYRMSKDVFERTRRDINLDLPRTRTWNLLIRSQVRYPITPADPQDEKLQQKCNKLYRA